MFELTNSGSGWTENVLLNFNSANGTGPSPLAFDLAGNLYGTFGGTGQKYDTYRSGTIYELTNGSGGWTHSIFFTFQTPFTTGSAPEWGVSFDSSGNLYGTTNGAIPIGDIAGRLFEMSAPSWTESTLYQLSDTTTTHGQREDFSGPLTIDALGIVYAAVEEYGFGIYLPNDGFIFRVGPSGSATFTFPLLEPADRTNPLGGLAVDSHGNVYGATLPKGQAPGWVYEVIF